MCIVTYIPLAEDSFIIVSSREENQSRPSMAPQIYTELSSKLLYPKEEISNGTWIITGENGRAACLLNGAFYPYTKKGSYKHSRGLIPIEYINHKSFMNFYFQYDLSEIEPFTLIAYEDKSLFELRWDGQRHHVKTLIKDNPYIWSSVTLYKAEAIVERQKRFENWLNTISEIKIEEIFAFHKAEKELKQHNLSTLSLTGLLFSKNGSRMIYEDFTTGITVEENLTFKNKS